MVLIDKLSKRKVYLELRKEGVIVLKKDFSDTPHKETNVPNLHVWMLLRSLKDRDFVTLVFNWQYYYYFLNQEGHAYLNNFLGLTDNVVPLTWIKDDNKKYEVRTGDSGRPLRAPRGPGERGDRPDRGDGVKGGRGRRREGGETEAKQPEAPVTSAPVETAASS